MDKPGASAKHLDFHLQREKALTKELEGKCKALQAQIAQLEQDKAELRREKIALSDEIKRSSKLDDRVHFLQKENDHKDELLEIEKAKVADAVAETERIRSKANASISAWTEAEQQWISEQESLNAEIRQLREQVGEISEKHAILRESHDDAVHGLTKKTQQCEKLETSSARLEAEVTSLHAQLEKSQTKVFDLEQTIYRLDLAGVKQKEALSLKDTEINSLEAKIAQHLQNEEKFEQVISSLNDRINAAKMMDLQGKGEKERLFCDISDTQKENQRLKLQIEALKRDVNLGTQAQANLQAVVDELRGKCTTQLEDIKERSVQIRKDELTISQQQMELNKLQSQKDEWEFRFNAVQGELREAQEQLSRQVAQLADEQLANRKLQADNQALMTQIRLKDEAIVVAEACAADNAAALRNDIDSLEREVEARQQMIKELTNQLAEANEKNSSYHSKILEEVDASSRIRQLISNLQHDGFCMAQDVLFLQCVREKYDIYAAEIQEATERATGLLAQAWGEQSARSIERICQLESQLEAGHAALQGTQSELSSQTAALARAEERIAEMTTVAAEREATVEQLSATHAEVAVELESKNQIIEELKVLLQEAECVQQSLQILNQQNQNERIAMRETVSRRDAVTSELSQWLSDAQDTMTHTAFAKNALLLDAFTHFVQTVTGASEQFAAQKESLEKRCRELESFAKETKAALLHKDVALAEKESANEEKMTSLKKALAVVEKEKSQINFQLTSLLARFEEEHDAFEAFKERADNAAATAAATQEKLENETDRLRKGIEYELRRKSEYKEALEKVRRLRDESETLRTRESKLTEEAIASANQEVSYWVDAFDRLKRMVENAKHGGQALPTVDGETAARLETAKSKLFGPIRTQDVNTGNPTALLKRRRVESD